MMFSVTRTVSIGILTQLWQALLLVPIGLAAFLFSFVLLWLADGLPKHAVVAEQAQAVDASREPVPMGRPVTATGPLSAVGPVTQDPGWASGGEWIALVRVVEVFAWHEEVSATSERQWGGRVDTEYTYSYELDWAQNVPDSSQFVEPGHDNPHPNALSAVYLATGASLGGATFTPEQFGMMPGVMRVEPSSFTLRGRLATATHTGYRLYLDGADPESARLGDHRVVYYGIPSGETVTALGQVTKGAWGPIDHKGFPVFDVIAGDRATAIDVLGDEDTMRLWLFRIVGFLMMWGGLFLLGSFVYCIFDIAPPVGLFARIVGAAITFFPAAFLTAVTVGVSIVGHNPWWTAAVLSVNFTLMLALYYVWPPVARRFGWGRRNRVASSNA